VIMAVLAVMVAGASVASVNKAVSGVLAVLLSTDTTTPFRFSIKSLRASPIFPMSTSLSCFGRLELGPGAATAGALPGSGFGFGGLE